jgi:hypothetical protein
MVSYLSKPPHRSTRQQDPMAQRAMLLAEGPSPSPAPNARTGALFVGPRHSNRLFQSVSLRSSASPHTPAVQCTGGGDVGDGDVDVDMLVQDCCGSGFGRNGVLVHTGSTPFPALNTQDWALRETRGGGMMMMEDSGRAAASTWHHGGTVPID